MMNMIWEIVTFCFYYNERHWRLAYLSPDNDNDPGQMPA
jgi:hypothetical protein